MRRTLTSARASILIVGAIGGLLAARGAPAETAQVYRIGNSFSWDSRPIFMDAVSASTPTPIHSGYHIRCSSSLATIAGDQTTCEAPTSEGVWQEALGGYAWDFLVVQPFRGANATLASDLASIGTFVEELESNPANESTQLLIYQSWAFQSGAELWSNWLAPAGSNTQHRQAYYRQLESELALQGIEADVIPNADVLYYVINHLDEFDAVDSLSDLYRDQIHMSSIGQFIAGMTVLTYLNGEDLTGTDQGAYANLTDTQRDQFQSVIWKIVNAVQNPGDFNADGVLSQDDYTGWAAAYGSSAAGYDANLDGVVDAADYTIWRDAMAQQPSTISTPEPTAAVLAACGLLGLRRRVAR